MMALKLDKLCMMILPHLRCSGSSRAYLVGFITMVHGYVLPLAYHEPNLGAHNASCCRCRCRCLKLIWRIDRWMCWSVLKTERCVRLSTCGQFVCILTCQARLDHCPPTTNHFIASCVPKHKPSSRLCSTNWLLFGWHFTLFCILKIFYTGTFHIEMQ